MLRFKHTLLILALSSQNIVLADSSLTDTSDSNTYEEKSSFFSEIESRKRAGELIKAFVDILEITSTFLSPFNEDKYKEEPLYSDQFVSEQPELAEEERLSPDADIDEKMSQFFETARQEIESERHLLLLNLWPAAKGLAEYLPSERIQTLFPFNHEYDYLKPYGFSSIVGEVPVFAKRSIAPSSLRKIIPPLIRLNLFLKDPFIAVHLKKDYPDLLHEIFGDEQPVIIDLLVSVLPVILSGDTYSFGDTELEQIATVNKRIHEYLLPKGSGITIIKPDSHIDSYIKYRDLISPERNAQLVSRKLPIFGSKTTPQLENHLIVISEGAIDSQYFSYISTDAGTQKMLPPDFFISKK
ncbi:hypothetical protein EOPP23_02045 [Endozoicomonas sp. OPT23]|nr:hypothetical protein [Endozoicomonas sp. OPT23]